MRGKDLVRPERLELPAYWFEASRSIQLSYGRTLAYYTGLGRLIACQVAGPKACATRAENNVLTFRRHPRLVGGRSVDGGNFASRHANVNRELAPMMKQVKQV